MNGHLRIRRWSWHSGLERKSMAIPTVDGKNFASWQGPRFACDAPLGWGYAFSWGASCTPRPKFQCWQECMSIGKMISPQTTKSQTVFDNSPTLKLGAPGGTNHTLLLWGVPWELAKFFPSTVWEARDSQTNSKNKMPFAPTPEECLCLLDCFLFTCEIISSSVTEATVYKTETF